MSHDPAIKSLIDHIESEGEVRSAMQYQHKLSDIDIRRPEGMELILKDDAAGGGGKDDSNRKVQPVKKGSSTKKPEKSAAEIARDKERRKAELRTKVDAFIHQTKVRKIQSTTEFLCKFVYFTVVHVYNSVDVA